MGETRNVDRRAFIKGSAAATAALGALTLAGCQENALKEDESLPATGPGDAFAANEEGAEWHSVPCWHNCGGRCLNKVLIKDGVVLRMKTDDTHEDSWEWPQQRGCLRGRAQQQQIFGPDRIKYPMKRKNWSPENPNGHLRGIDEWERISWDEALDIYASELKKAKDKYGNESILYFNITSLEGFLGAVLAKFGGFVDTTSIDSAGTYTLAPAMYGVPMNNVNDRFDLVNADYIVLYGHNPAWCSFPNTYYLKEAHKQGVKFLFVGPEYNVSAGVFDAKWFPVRQGTDTAFLLGVAHSMLSQDNNGSVVDWDFLDRCTVGFDADHMPADARTDENFYDYLMGAYDGIEKTPEWASEICGCPVERIEEYASIMGKNNNVMVISNCAPARNRGAENLPQIQMTVGAMGGHYGKPGNTVNADIGGDDFDGGPVLLTAGMGGYPWQMNTLLLENKVPHVIPNNELWSAILEGHYYDSGIVHFGFTEQVEREVDVHVIISEHHNRLATCEGTMKGIEAFRKVDFVAAQAYWLKSDAKYADLVLPVTTRWETQMFTVYMAYVHARDVAFGYEKAIEPLYEARSDLDIALDLADRLGVDVSDVLPVGNMQSWFNSMCGSAIMQEDGSYAPLLTITQEDIDKYEVEGEPQEGVITLSEFVEKGIYRIKREPGDFGAHIWLEDFVKDPEANPLDTVSGKMEIYCQSHSDYLDMANKFTPHYTPVSPLPKWLPSPEGYVASFTNWDTKEVGPYPYLVSNSHYLRRAHSDYDNLPWLRELWPNPIFISEADAKEKGIESGDIVRVWNDNGQILRPASVLRTIMPGTLELPHGAAAEIDEETGIDIAGADNVLCSPNKATCTTSNGWNSTLVNFEKYTGDIELKPDCEWAPRMPLGE